MSEAAALATLPETEVIETEKTNTVNGRLDPTDPVEHGDIRKALRVPQRQAIAIAPSLH